MRRNTTTWIAGATLLALIVTGAAYASAGLGGGGGEQAGEEVKKVRLKPFEEASKVYGWVRISADQFNMGANRLEKDAIYSIYFVNAAERELIKEEDRDPAVRSDGIGEAKYAVRLTEPLGAQWDKVVLYYHPDGNAESAEGMVPVLEGSLRE